MRPVAHGPRRVASVGLILTLVAVTQAACVPAPAAGTLPPTLTLQDVPGGQVAYQSGIPVPTFTPQRRATIDLSGSWRIQLANLDHDLSMTDRKGSLGAIEREAAGRQTAAYDDSAWSTIAVPGSYDPPPNGSQGGAWYRRTFLVPASWTGSDVTLKFDAVDYMADVWVNGTYVGYHEGGSTPFAFDVTPELRVGQRNVIAVRVDDPPWGTRTDIVPWGLADWWDYAGITQPVWLEATPQVAAVRADVTPHLDGADVAVVVRNAGSRATAATVQIQILATDSTQALLSDPYPADLVPRGALPIGTTAVTIPAISAHGSQVISVSFAIAHPTLWTPSQPALYVVRVTTTAVSSGPTFGSVPTPSPSPSPTPIPSPSPTLGPSLSPGPSSTAGSTSSAGPTSSGLLAPSSSPSSSALLAPSPGGTSGGLLSPSPIPGSSATALFSPNPGVATGTLLSPSPGSGPTASPSPSASPSTSASPTPGGNLFAVPTSPPGGLQVTRDQLDESFGLRRISVDPDTPRLLLNGRPISFTGVAFHDEWLTAGPSGVSQGQLATIKDQLSRLDQAAAVHAQLLRTDHNPADPRLLDLTDRLGFAVWEEIPLYHLTPYTLENDLSRGIAQQMLREMDLRDMDHPSVLFHGLANESMGGAQLTAALTTLRDVDRDIDGTRLTGQAAYGFDPTSTTSAPLDVAGFTFYYGVFYGQDVAAETRHALALAHATYPHKPIMILEFGRWANGPAGPATQQQIAAETDAAIAPYMGPDPGQYVGAEVWWTLDDYSTMVPGIDVEHFGLFAPDGSIRPAGSLLALRWAPVAAGQAPLAPGAASAPIVSSGSAVAVAPTSAASRLLQLFGYGLGGAALAMLALLLLMRRGGVAAPEELPAFRYPPRRGERPR